jgi:hypothetical protein
VPVRGAPTPPRALGVRRRAAPALTAARQATAAHLTPGGAPARAARRARTAAAPAGIIDDGDDGHGGSQAIDPGLFEGNLITDPSFEAGHSGWAPFGTLTIVDVEGDAHGGLKYIAATNRSQQWMGPDLAVDSLVTGGTSYEVSAWARVTGENLPTNLTLRSSCEGNPDTTYTVLASDTVGDEWTLLTGTFAAPTCALLELDILVEGPPAGVDIFVDDVALRALP